MNTTSPAYSNELMHMFWLWRAKYLTTKIQNSKNNLIRPGNGIRDKAQAWFRFGIHCSRTVYIPEQFIDDAPMGYQRLGQDIPNTTKALTTNE